MKLLIAALLLVLPGLASAQTDLAPRVERLECHDSGGMWQDSACTCAEGKEPVLGQGCVAVVVEPEPDPDPVDPAPPPVTSYIPVEETEATREHFHKTANALWKNFGGDWVDKAGVPQGSEPFAQGGAVVGEVRLDISAMLDGWTGLLLRSTGDYAEIWSSTGEVPPYLLVDGQKITPRAAVEVSESTYKNQAGEPRLQMNQNTRVALLDFDIPGGAQNATLVVYQIRGRGEIQVYRLDAPPFNPWLSQPVEYGIGKGKTIDELDVHPDVIATWDYREGWEGKYPKAIDGVKQGPFFERANVGPVLGYVKDEHGETWVHTMFRGAEGEDDGPRSPHHVNLRFKPAPDSIDLNETGGLDSVYFQYRVKTLFDAPTKEEDKTLDGGKWPGIDGRYGYINPANGGYWRTVTGNGGTPAPGLFYPEGTVIRGADYTGKPIMAGWSARGQWTLMAGPDGPLRDVTSVGSYLYHPGWTYVGAGDTQMWEGVGLLPGVEYTIEHFIQINSVADADEFGNGVGQPDGIHRIWVNGRLVRDVTDFVFTHNSYMNAKGVWGLFMHGGTKAPQVSQEFLVGPFVVAKKYIGPRFDETVVEPPVEPPVEPEPEDPPVEPGVSPLTTMQPGELRELLKYECRDRVPTHDLCHTTWNSYGGWMIWEEGDVMIQYSGAHSVANVTSPDTFSLIPPLKPGTDEPEWQWEYMFKPMTCEEVATGEHLLAPIEEGGGYWMPSGDRIHPHATTRHSYDQVVIAPKGPDKVPYYFHFTQSSNPGHCKDYWSSTKTVHSMPLISEPIWEFSKIWEKETRGWDFNKPAEYDPVSGFIVTTKSRRIFWYDQNADEIVASVYSEPMSLKPSANLVYFPKTDKFYLFDGYAMRIWEITPNRENLNETTIEEIFPTGYGPVSSRVMDTDTINNVIGVYKDGIWHTLYPEERRWVAHQMPQNIGRVSDHAGRFYRKAGVFMLHTGGEGTPRYTAFAWKPDLKATPLPEPPVTVQ